MYVFSCESMRAWQIHHTQQEEWLPELDSLLSVLEQWRPASQDLETECHWKENEGGIRGDEGGWCTAYLCAESRRCGASSRQCVRQCIRQCMSTSLSGPGTTPSHGQREQDRELSKTPVSAE